MYNEYTKKYCAPYIDEVVISFANELPNENHYKFGKIFGCYDTNRFYLKKRPKFVKVDLSFFKDSYDTLELNNYPITFLWEEDYKSILSYLKTTQQKMKFRSGYKPYKTIMGTFYILQYAPKKENIEKLYIRNTIIKSKLDLIEKTPVKSLHTYQVILDRKLGNDGFIRFQNRSNDFRIKLHLSPFMRQDIPDPFIYYHYIIDNMLNVINYCYEKPLTKEQFNKLICENENMKTANNTFIKIHSITIKINMHRILANQFTTLMKKIKKENTNNLHVKEDIKKVTYRCKGKYKYTDIQHKIFNDEEIEKASNQFLYGKKSFDDFFYTIFPNTLEFSYKRDSLREVFGITFSYFKITNRFSDFIALSKSFYMYFHYIFAHINYKEDVELIYNEIKGHLEKHYNNLTITELNEPLRKNHTYEYIKCSKDKKDKGKQYLIKKVFLLLFECYTIQTDSMGNHILTFNIENILTIYRKKSFNFV